MIPLPLAWTLTQALALTASLWTSGSSQIILQQPLKDVYPALNSPESIECDCSGISCSAVFWIRSIVNQSQIQFIGFCNNAERVIHGAGIEKSRFRLSKTGNAFVLRIVAVKIEDAGIYSCIVKESNKETWRSGIRLRPGETPPRPPGDTTKENDKKKPPVKSNCPCNNKNLINVKAVTWCISWILWPLVGLAAGLALALFCTLYYFSQLPKKCRHKFQKKRPFPR
ncbi:uncharacterized protein cd8b [Echeneis naucrates]|uniref:Uncharacterized LOC115044182 n=1 Tax=Echeneis naucrates TaxID=173247 RepID=A0A665T7Z8_ECHNA|nr:uncharacterized protein LOC115044182 [Echeneis naucrates]XP_029358951.1 uncharacterized protein LOC115044182 [Echeneis naucrates]